MPPPFPPFSFWKKHTASIPKGHLRYWVLKLLSEKPLSGSEIMDIMENDACRYWRPSPGSIYPLLALFLEKGYISELPKDESGKKRYKITDKGMEILEEYEKMRERVETPLFLGPFMFDTFRFKNKSALLNSLRTEAKKVFISLYKLKRLLSIKHTEDMLIKVKELLRDVGNLIEEKIKEISEEHKPQ
ncbi:MAG: PadR family transcriptional regulator [Candidatus Odinarchaeia archaeon]